jgi:hypothetical protein
MKQLAVLVMLLGGSACVGVPEQTPADAFMANLAGLCGQVHQGRLTTTDPADRDFAGKTLVMGPVRCEGTVIAVPFAVGEDRSRTWVISRNGEGLRLKHVHRHADGHEDKVSQYGGDTQAPGSSTRQEFPADEFSKELFRQNGLERSITNVWAFEVVPGRHVAYELRRPNRFFRVEFALPRP